MTIRPIWIEVDRRGAVSITLTQDEHEGVIILDLDEAREVVARLSAAIAEAEVGNAPLTPVPEGDRP